ncbi:MAG: hypothetical protein Q9170_003204 [Blastenia crenularia]
MDWTSNTNGQVNVREGGEINILGAAGPYTVVGSNFAPGTTAADIESAMAPIGGEVLDCQITSQKPTVVAEMVFSEKARAENVIATFNNKRADGRLLHVYMKVGKPVNPPKPASHELPRDELPQPDLPRNDLPFNEPPRSEPPRNAPSEPKAARSELTYEEDSYSKQREQSDRNRRRAEPEFQDGSYGFEAKGDRMDVDNDDRRGIYNDRQRHYGRGRDMGRPREDRRLYSDDLYPRPRGRGFRLTAAFTMAATMTVSALEAEQETQWNEAQIESALARLQGMHAQLRHLRDVVPRLIDPMLSQQSSPEDLYAAFASNVSIVQSDIKDFSRFFQSSEYKEIFQKAEESRAQSNEVIRGWRVTEHADWLDVRNVDSPMNLGGETTNSSDPHASEKTTLGSDDLHAAIDRFKKANTGIEVALDEDSKLMKITLPPQAYTRFDIRYQPSSGTDPAYTITTAEKTSLHAAMVKTINSRAQPNNLDFLLVSLQDQGRVA